MLISRAVLASLLLSVLMTAQQAVTTTGGTTNELSLFTGSSSIGNSVITQSNGNIGIGTTTPSNSFELKSSQPGLFWNGANGYYNSIENGQVIVRDKSTTSDFWWIGLKQYSTSGPGIDFLGGTQNPAGARVSFWTNVGIGTGLPGAKLEVDGSIKLTTGSGGTVVFADGTTQSTAWTGVLCGGDYAESVDTSGARNQYEPGDVLIVDPDHYEAVIRSTTPYSTSVAGVYSRKPGALGARSNAPDKLNTQVPMAMVGIVPTKVTAENGPIRPGDLLVSSSTSGYAMKGTDRSRMMGAVIGKAFGTLTKGEGVIDVLVTLQ